MEFFHDPVTEKLTVIEFNPRMAAQFSDLYLRVNGVDLHRLGLELAFGRDPARLPRAEPSAGAAASFVYRCFDPAERPAMPGAAQQAALAERFPDAMLFCFAKSPGQIARDFKWLGSYRYGILHLGGRDARDLQERCRKPVNCSVGRHLMRGSRRKPLCRPAIQHPIFPWRFPDDFSLHGFFSDRTAHGISAAVAKAKAAPGLAK